MNQISNQVSALEAKTRFGKLLARVTRGEEVVITRHEKPVARLVPEGGPNLAAARRAVVGLRQLQQQIAERRGPKLTRRDVRSAIAAGRK